MFRKIPGLYALIMSIYLLAIPMGKLSGSAKQEVSSEPTQLTPAYQISLPLIVSPIDERPFLMAIYNSAGGDGMARNTGWNTDSPYCDWHGVSCDAVRHVTGLDLSYNSLAGTLPPEIGNLVFLTELDLSSNYL